MIDLRHLVWIPAGAAVGFGSSFLFSDVAGLPSTAYQAVYFTIVLGFLGLYARTTDLDVGSWAGRRLGRGLALGVVGGLVLLQGVLARPGTPSAGGPGLWGDLLWRGLAYGAIDGMLLLAFPWLVAWRALDAEGSGWGRKLRAAGVAWLGVLLITTSYHLGYGDFRSRKILQPNVGATIGAVPTLVTANPVASVVSHVVLHAAAVVHVPDSELYLPPHRRGE